MFRLLIGVTLTSSVCMIYVFFSPGKLGRKLVTDSPKSPAAEDEREDEHYDVEGES